MRRGGCRLDRNDGKVDALFDRMATLSALLAYVGSTERAADEVPRLEGELAWMRESLAASGSYAEDLKETLRIAQEYSDESSRRAPTQGRGTGHSACGVGPPCTPSSPRESILGRILLRRIER